MPIIGTKDCKYIMGSINRGNDYRKTCADQLFEEFREYIESASPVKTFAKALFNRKPPVIHIPNIPRCITTNNTEIDDVDKFKLISEYNIIAHLERHIGHVKINCEYTGYSNLTLTVEFVPKMVNNPEEEQSVDLPTADDEERETTDDRILRKETSW
jgi:hypothetical protein